MRFTRKTVRQGTSDMTRWEGELFLLTPAEYKQLPDGTILTCINGEDKIKGADYIDQETRFGHLAYGVKDPWNHELKDMFLIFKLVQ